MDSRCPYAKWFIDSGAVEEAIRLIVGAGNVTELRALEATANGDRRPATYFGYFDDPAKLAQAMTAIKSAKGIYFVPNRVDPALMARAENRIRKAGKGDTTSDGDIIGRRWLLIDLDAQRASGISASEAEHEAAIEKAREIQTKLQARDWTDPVVVDSGNGAHLLYRIDLPADDAELVKQCLAALAQRFDDDAVKVDQTVHNPARIWKLPGTLACKGDNTADRPHRMARILSKPDKPCIVPADLLQALADEAIEIKAVAAPQVRASRNGRFSIDAFVAKHLDCPRGSEPYEGGRIWRLDTCPFNPAHVDGSAAIVEKPSGAIGFKCWHNGCTDRGWGEVRAAYEPKSNSKPAENKGHPRAPVMLRMVDVSPEPIHWLWPGKIALGKLSMIVGDPGLGKSFLTLDMAARISTGAPWPDSRETPNPAGGVILLSAEDDPGDTIRPRLDAAHADVSRIA
ncbi:MAG: AAA family ATPase, partial [Phycisphaerae bacterium]